MIDTSIGKIFLSSERGLTETDWFRSYSTFNFGEYQDKHKAPVGPLYVLNDETLESGRQLHYFVEKDSLIVLLPVVGTISCKSEYKEITIQAGELQVVFVPANSDLLISNPYENQLVNYLQLWFQYPIGEQWCNVLPFDIDKNIDQLLTIFQSGIKVSIGKFSGRSEAVYNLSPNNSVFVFVIQGDFEVQCRLLEAKDGLALENVKEIEMEALSNEAIILIAELPGKF